MSTESKVILWCFPLVGFIFVLDSDMHTSWKTLMFFLLFPEPIFLGVRWLYRKSRQ